MASRWFESLSVFEPPHRWPQTSTRCWQTKVTCWSAAAWSRSKVKGKWPPTSWTTGLPTVSRQGERPTPRPRPAEGHSSTERGLTVQRSGWNTRDAITWIPSKEMREKREKKKIRLLKDFKTESVLDERKMFSPAILAHVHVEGQVFISCRASLSGFLKDAKSVYLKQTPFSLCQKKINAVHKATFSFPLAVLFLSLFFLRNLFISHGLWNRYSCFCLLGWLFILNLNVLCKRSFMKKCEYIRAQISSLLHVYKCVCTCIFVCVWIYVQTEEKYIDQRLKYLLKARQDMFDMFRLNLPDCWQQSLPRCFHEICKKKYIFILSVDAAAKRWSL